MSSIRKTLFKWFTLFFAVSFLLVWVFEIIIFKHNNNITRHQQVASLIIFMMLIFLLIILGSKYLSRYFTKPLHNFAGYLKKTAENELIKCDLNIKSSRFFEINQVNNELFHLIEKIRKKETESRRFMKNSGIENIVFKGLLDDLPQCIFETDESGRLLYVNKKFLETFNYNSTSLNEKNLSIQDILITDSADKVYNENAYFEADLFGVRSDCSLFPVIICSSNIYENDKIKGIRGLIIDNTKRMEFINELQDSKNRAEELNNLKTSFLANISNELRIPVNAIFGFSNLAILPGCSEETRNNYLYHIIDSGEQLLKIMDDVIDISKIETGELNIAKYKFDLNDLITEVFIYFRQLKRKVGKNNIELRLQNDFKIEPCYIYTDPLRLRQILNNLLNNALKYTNSGHIEFGYSDFGSTIQFYVKDTGIGIPDRMQPVIFDRFRRTEQTTGKEYGGKGLSLTITKSLVKLLGGRIWMNSTEGVGSDFYFTIENDLRKSDKIPGEKLLNIEVTAN